MRRRNKGAKETDTLGTNHIDSHSQKEAMQRGEKIVFAFLLLLLLAPTLMGVVMAQDLLTIGQRCIYLLSALLLCAAGLCVFCRRTFFYVASSTFVFAAIEIIHLVLNKATTSLLFVFTVLKSEKGEFLELCSTYWFVAVIFFAVWGLYFYLAHRFIRQEYIGSRKCRMVLLGVIAAFFATDIVALKLRPKLRNEFSIRNIDLRTAAWVGAEKICPVNMLLALYHIGDMAYDIHEQNEQLEDFSFGIPRVSDCDSTVVLFLIGETSRYDHWQINGYERATSPRLCMREGLLSFDSCFSVANLTTVSVPLMLSRATPQTQELYAKEKSVVDAFHEAGYTTAWIADQSFNNHFLQRIASHCTYTDYVTPNSENEVFVDTVLLEPLRHVLSEGDAHQMIVLHSLGCHFKYSSRYPDDFQVFTPDMKGMSMHDIFSNMDVDDEGGVSWRDLRPENIAAFRNLKAIAVNSYDNAILFTDYFIDRVISELEQTGRPAVLVYVGDHGENLLDDERNMFMHGTFSGSFYEYHVPLFVWTSDSYRLLHPEVFDAMESNRSKKLSTMYLFHSLLDLGGVSYANLDTTRCINRPSMQAATVVYGLDANMHTFEIPTQP